MRRAFEQQVREEIAANLGKDEADVQYCNNDPCEAQAVWFYRTESGGVFNLCQTCKEAFELGQANQNSELEGL